ncbi:MAG: ATP-binding cassette domain-containing protein [Flavobacteriia bacterium]|nr:ATP-binding cassette domain-containing protein [Flavobacteriia bacterium]
MNNEVIHYQNVSLYQGDNMILKGIDLNVLSNEIIYLIGKTGSGKSSLLKSLFGELPIYDGEAKACGFHLNALRKKEIPLLRRKIGIVFQDFQLLNDRTIEKNLLFVLKATGWKDKKLMNDRIHDVLSMVGLEDKLKNKPHTLSGGEQQRVSIARALLNKPELILADEPTGNLDPETSEEIMKVLIASAKDAKAAVIMATHDMSVVEKFPGKIYRVEQTTIKEVTPINRFNPFKQLDL